MPISRIRGVLGELLPGLCKTFKWGLPDLPLPPLTSMYAIPAALFLPPGSPLKPRHCLQSLAWQNRAARRSGLLIPDGVAGEEDPLTGGAPRESGLQSPVQDISPVEHRRMALQLQEEGRPLDRFSNYLQPCSATVLRAGAAGREGDELLELGTSYVAMALMADEDGSARCSPVPSPCNECRATPLKLSSRTTPSCLHPSASLPLQSSHPSVFLPLLLSLMLPLPGHPSPLPLLSLPLSCLRQLRPTASLKLHTH